MDEIGHPILGKMCWVGLRADDSQVIKEMKKGGDCERNELTVIDKCPDDHVKKCSGSHFMYYYYDTKVETMTCDEIYDLK